MSATNSLIQHFNKQQKYNQVIIINGDNLKDSVAEQNNFFLKYFTNVQILGDGKTHITIEEIESFFDSLNTAPKIISDNALLVIHHHGNVHQFKGDSHQSHVLANGNDKKSYHIARVFQFITKPIDIILASCHSGAAINDIDKLPSGSRLLTLSDESHSLLEVIYTSTLKISETKQFSLKSLYYYNLLATSSYTNFAYPIFCVSGEKGHISFGQNISNISKVTTEQKAFLTSNLPDYICPNTPQDSCQKTILEYAKKIENMHNISEIKQNLVNKEHLDVLNAIELDKKNPTADTQRELDQIAKISEYYNVPPLRTDLEKVYNDTDDDDDDDDTDMESVTTTELCAVQERYSDDLCNEYHSEFGTSLAIIAGLNEYHEINA